MTITLENLLDSIRTRKQVSAYGIGVASAYLQAIVPCLTGGELCPVKLFGLASGDLWQKELDEAAARLTYCNQDMADPEFLSKSVREGTDITKGAVLEYDCILSSCRKDRDGDIVVQKGGLSVDLKMPALWQHIQVQPIGKHVALLDQDETQTKSRFALADTELGRDAATLVKFGALRKSIGFKPAKFEPVEIVKGADGKDMVRGWHIKEASVMEGSLVSIPANADAQIISASYAKEFDGLCTAHSRGLLKNTLVKHYAAGLYSQRPAQVRGVDLAAKETAVETKATLTLGGATIELSSKGASGAQMAGSGESGRKNCPKCGKSTLDSTNSCPQCGYVEGEPSKSAAAPTTKAVEQTTAPQADDIGEQFKSLAGLSTKLMGNEYLDGSFEKIQNMLRRTAGDYLRSKGQTVGRNSYSDLIATFPGSAVVCMYDYESSKSPCFKISYKTDKDGNASWDGDVQAVEVKQQIIEKAIRTPQAIACELTAKSITHPDAPGLLKACEDIGGVGQILRQQQNDRELRELVGLQ